MTLAGWAADYAEELLSPLGDRWSHVQGVVRRARHVLPILATADSEMLVAAAYLHDLGYAPSLVQTGMHALDGARHLRARGHERLAGLVAYHSGARREAELRGLAAEKGGVLRTCNFRVKVWLPAVRAAGLAPLRPHDLRHTAVALWIAAGANPKEVSVRAGHLFPGHDDEVRDRLDAMHAAGLEHAAGGQWWS